MSESQFAYSGFTLDELRSLAASPQVGTMQAMPQSFRALADRVGEVADLLSHAQADLPNWWKGPAAEQAAATLGRAAAEARDFHDSAMGAASAISRCAQVVAEQQNQMMNVPDVQEPGVSAVVQRPTTPFEALEAARQDASYQAAHEQAVQVVNGIAAQYVETRSRLASINLFSGEGFSNPAIANGFIEGSRPFAESTPGFISAAGSSENPSPEPRVKPPFETSSYRQTIPREDLTAKRNLNLRRSTITEAPALPDNVVPAASIRRDSSLSTGAGSITHSDPLTTSATLENGTLPATFPDTADPFGRPTDNRRYGAAADSTRQALEDEIPTLPSSSETSWTPQVLTKSEYIDPADPNKSARIRKGSGENDDRSTSKVDTNPQLSSRVSPSDAEDHLYGDTRDGTSAIIPPFSGIGSVRNERERRNPRPSYLKERKSVWLPETFAAPPDGVIAPEWLKQL